jgi:hypothetical protein
MLTYFLMSKFVNKLTDMNIVISLSIVALIFIFGAHQIDKKRPFPNKHAWKMIATLLMAPVFLIAGV